MINDDATGVAARMHGYAARLGFGTKRIIIHNRAASPMSGNNKRDEPVSGLESIGLPVLGQNRKYLLKIFFIGFLG